MIPGNPFILRSQGQRSRSRGTKKYDCVGLQKERNINIDVCCWPMLLTAVFSVRGVFFPISQCRRKSRNIIIIQQDKFAETKKNLSNLTRSCRNAYIKVTV